jgi:hypothetical protein
MGRTLRVHEEREEGSLIYLEDRQLRKLAKNRSACDNIFLSRVVDGEGSDVLKVRRLREVDEEERVRDLARSKGLARKRVSACSAT